MNEQQRQKIIELKAKAWDSLSTPISCLEIAFGDKGEALKTATEYVIRVANTHKKGIDKYIDGIAE